MHLGQGYEVVGQWFYLHFVENPGMAFGLTIGEGSIGKLLLSSFRLVAVAGIGYYLFTLIKKKVRPLLIICVALIFAGALGNILDSVFYGKFFSASDQWQQNVAEAFPKEGGYNKLLHGQVVDMFYFPVVSINVPANFIFWGGEEVVFFRPVFNIADASISIGVFLLILFQKRLFGNPTPRLSKRRVLATNIFFGILTFILALFLLLTYFAIFAETRPLPPTQLWLAAVLSAALGVSMFDMLRRWPIFEPPLLQDLNEETQLPKENTELD